MSKILSLGILTIIGLLIGIGLGALIETITIPSTGTISTAKISLKWLDGTNVTEIDWGLTENNTAYTYEPINVTNIGTVPITLSLTTQNLSPSIISLTLTWNYTGTPLNPKTWILVVLTQTITATGAYTYDTIITATEV